MGSAGALCACLAGAGGEYPRWAWAMWRARGGGGRSMTRGAPEPGDVGFAMAARGGQRGRSNIRAEVVARHGTTRGTLGAGVARDAGCGCWGEGWGMLPLPVENEPGRDTSSAFS